MTLLGRGSQCINSGGEKIYPEEVEAALKAHPKVFDALVVGVADERWGQRVAAVVEPRPGATPTLDDLVEHCRTKMAGYKVPRQLHLVDRMPRHPSGKPDYRRARGRGRGGPSMKNRLTEMFGIEYPIFAFSHCRDVVAAVTNAGGMGVLGALAFSPEQLELELKWIDEHVNGRPYGVDVVMPVKTVDRDAGLVRHRRHRRQAARVHQPGALGLRRQDPRRPRRRRGRQRRRARVGCGDGRRACSGGPRPPGAPQIEIALVPRHRPARLRARAAAHGGDRPGPRSGREGRRAGRSGAAGGARRASRASTSSSPRATRPAATPARSRPWC